MSQAHVAELKRARERIRTGEASYICDALRAERVTNNLAPPWSDAGFEVVCQIRQDLGEGVFDLEEWLVRKFGRKEFPYKWPESKDVLRPTRLAWIDALIEYWKDKP